MEGIIGVGILFVNAEENATIPKTFYHKGAKKTKIGKFFLWETGNNEVNK
jgi:hypothetical protein